MSRQEQRMEGKKHDQNWSCFFWPKKCIFPQFKQILAQKVRRTQGFGHICVCIYIYAVELKTGPKFGVSSVKNWSTSSVKNWSTFFFHCFFSHFCIVFGVFLKTQVVSHCAKIVFLKHFGDVKK